MTEQDQSRDIVDEIDALVDEQLKQEKSGYDHNVNQERCPHCGRHWHGLPITSRVAAMYAAGEYDMRYSVDGDHSMVVCPGSTAPGPLTPAQQAWSSANPTYGRGYDADVLVFDEAHAWSEVSREKRSLKRIFGWAAVWGTAAAAVWLAPDPWSLIGLPVQWFALWKIIRAGRRKRRAATTPSDDSGIGPAWPYYRGPTLGFNSAHRVTFVQADVAAWRSDDGS